MRRTKAQVARDLPDRVEEDLFCEIEDEQLQLCLLYTSDAADERSSVDLGGRRIIKKKKIIQDVSRRHVETNNDSVSHSARYLLMLAY